MFFLKKKKKKKIDYKKILVFFVLALVIVMVEFLFIYSQEVLHGGVRSVNLTDLSCENVGGHWLEEKKECEYVNLNWCGAHGGIFEECKSDCVATSKNKDCDIHCVPTCGFDIKNKIFGISPDYATYSVDGKLIKLSGNYYNDAYDGNSFSNQIWGVRAGGDLNDDGFDDVAMILLQSIGNHKIYYLIVSLFDPQENKYLGTNAIYLGEKIVLDKIKIDHGEIIVKYFDRSQGELKFSQPKNLKILKAKIENENSLVKVLAALDYKDQLRVESVDFGSKISSPLIISGEARGSWFFKGSAPVVLTNWDGLIIAKGYLEAEKDLMTKDFIPFRGILEFNNQDIDNRGSLILRKDNPSGLAENDDAFEIQVYFDRT